MGAGVPPRPDRPGGDKIFLPESLTVATNDALIGSLMRELMSRRGFQATITTPKRDKMWAIETAYLADSGSDYQDGFLSLREALEYGVKVMREYDDER